MAVDPFAALVTETEGLAREFERAGKTLYLVGGIVRDTLLRRVRDDLDIDLTTDALPDEIEAIVRRSRPSAVWTQGKRFGTIGATVPVPGAAGSRDVEITTHRAEQYHDSSRKPEVNFSTDITLDLSRRDFTVNAMAFDLGRHMLLDPFGGQKDLGAYLLRTPLSPEISFRDDPLRMMRAARFIAALALRPDPGLHEAVIVHGHRLSIVSAERIRDELLKLLRVADPTNGLRFLASTTLLQRILPELAPDLVGRAMARVAGSPADSLIRLTALVWDCLPDARSRKIRLQTLKCSSSEMVFVDEMLRLQECDLSVAVADDAGARRFARDAGEHRAIFLTIAHLDAEVASQERPESDQEAVRIATIRQLEARLADLARNEDLDDLQPEIDGERIMALLGLAPGREVGRALAELLDLRLDRGLVGPTEAERHLLAWWEQRRRETAASPDLN